MNRSWKDISVTEYRRFCDATSLMEQDAFNYFVPGWMTVSLLDRTAADVVPDYLIHRMAGLDEWSLRRIEHLYAHLNSEQLHCVQDFIEWYLGDDRDDKMGIANARSIIKRWITITANRQSIRMQY